MYMCYCMTKERNRCLAKVRESTGAMGLSRREVIGFLAHGKEWNIEGRTDSLIFQVGYRCVG